jgi:hypothetical protein
LRPDLVRDIRRFYLLPPESYSLAELAEVWHVSLDDVRAMYFDRLGETRDDAMIRIEWMDAVKTAAAFHVYRPVDVEYALGIDFARVYGEAYRTVPVLVCLPRHIIDRVRTRPFVPAPETIAARVERIIFEALEIDEILGAVGS